MAEQQARPNKKDGRNDKRTHKSPITNSATQNWYYFGSLGHPAGEPDNREKHDIRTEQVSEEEAKAEIVSKNSICQWCGMLEETIEVFRYINSYGDDDKTKDHHHKCAQKLPVDISVYAFKQEL